MVMIFNKQFLFMVLISMASGMVSFRRQIQVDKICHETRSILCVNSTLMEIRKAVIDVERIAKDIERDISKSPNFGRLYESAHSKIESIRSYLPNEKYYKMMRLELPNIDKDMLGHLLKEMHHAMTFYYNSIDNMITKTASEKSWIDPRFQVIKAFMGDDIICQFRSIMAVYSLEWPFTYQVNHIRYHRNDQTETESTANAVQALLIAKLLEDWTKIIRYVIENLNMRYY